MGTSLVQKTLWWLFGEEGAVARETKLQIVITATVMSVTGVFLISPIVSTLTGPFGVTDAQAGQLLTVFTAPSIVFVPILGVLADRIGRKPVLIGGLLVFGIAGGMIGLTTSFTVAIALRVVQGIGYAAIMLIGVAVLGDYYTGSREATAQGLRVTSIFSINIIAPLLAGVLVVGSWRYPFFVYFLAILVAVWAYVSLPVTVISEATPIRTYLDNVYAAIVRPIMALILLSFVVRFGLTFGFYAYVSVLLSRVFDSSSVVVGLVIGGSALVSLVFSAQAGRFTSTWNSFFVMAIGFVLFGIGTVLLGLTSLFPVVIGGVVLFSMGSGVTGPIQKSLVTQLVSISERAGAVSSAIIFQSIGQTAGPLTMGILLQFVPVAQVFVLIGIVGGISGVALFVIAYRLNPQIGVLKLD